MLVKHVKWCLISVSEQRESRLIIDIRQGVDLMFYIVNAAVCLCGSACTCVRVRTLKSEQQQQTVA